MGGFIHITNLEKKSSKAFQSSRKIAENLESSISFLSKKISDYLSDLYEKSTGNSTTFSIDTARDETMEFLLSHEYDNSNSYEFGYYLRFKNTKYEIYFSIMEDIVDIKRDHPTSISRRTKVSMESEIHGKMVKIYFGVTNSGSICVDSKEFYSDPASVLSSNEKLSRIFE